ncbi:MAG TPA: universal stress protein [Actinomycetota bacterium]|nr:universal stress protein [Actinomycetota bacterium]
MFERILVAIDSSEPSERAVELAAGLAKDHGSEMIVLHAVPRIVSRSGASDLEEPGAASELVDQIVRDLKDRGLNARGEVVRVLEGHMARGIVESAASADADVILMGARGRSDFGGLFLGSVTHRVLHLVEKPVIVVP